MQATKKSYQNVLKATSLFGGVQVIRILITIIRSKIIAQLLGPEGVGISNLLSRPLQLITTATQLGLDKSAVKEIAIQNAQSGGSPLKQVFILKRLVWITACIGALLMIVFSSVLSRFTFNTDTYTIAFVWLGLAVIFNQFAMSNLAILQGLRGLRFLAKANIYGSIVGVIVTLPLYYFYKLDGILPAILISSAVIFIFSYVYARKVIKEQGFSELPKSNNFISEAKPMIRLGVALGFSSVISLLVAYLILVYIRSSGGAVASGYYAAGIVILNTYVGLIFNAMSTDYYPRLAAICDDLKQIVKTVFEQAFIAILLITPIIIGFIAFAPLLISILYSSKFEPTVLLVRWGILGMVFKTVSWSIGYVIIAKGDSKIFIKTSIGFNSALLLLNVLGYRYFGLEGVGISLLVYYIIHFIVVKAITFYRYGFRMQSGFYAIFVKCLLLCSCAFAASYIQELILKYSILVVLIIISSLYSFRLLDEKIGFKSLISSIFKKRK